MSEFAVHITFSVTPNGADVLLCPTPKGFGLDADEAIPCASELAALTSAPRFVGWSFGVVNVAEEIFESEPARVNISLPRRVLARLDAQAKAAGKCRSGYIAEMTLRARP